jgi:hypothetical protein
MFSDRAKIGACPCLYRHFGVPGSILKSIFFDFGNPFSSDGSALIEISI